MHPRRIFLGETLDDGASELLERVERGAAWADKQPEVFASDVDENVLVPPPVVPVLVPREDKTGPVANVYVKTSLPETADVPEGVTTVRPLAMLRPSLPPADNI